MLVAQRHAGHQEPAPAAVLLAQPALGLVGRVGREVGAQRGAHLGAIVRVHEGGQHAGAVGKLLLRVAQQGLQARRVEHGVGPHVPVPQAGAGAARGQLIAHLAGTQRRVGFLQHAGAFAQFVEHRIEGVDQLPDLVVAALGGPHVEGAAIEHRARHATDFLDRAGQRLLQPVRQQQGAEQAGHRHRHQPADVLGQLRQHAMAGLHVDAADHLVVGVHGPHRGRRCPAKAQSGRRHLGRHVAVVRVGLPVLREQASLRVVQGGGQHARLGLQHAQVLLARTAVAEGQGGFARQPHHRGLRGQIGVRVAPFLARVHQQQGDRSDDEREADGGEQDQVQLLLDAVGGANARHVSVLPPAARRPAAWN